MGSDAPIVVAYDGSTESEEAIRHAGRLMPGRKAIVMTVWLSYSSVSRMALAAVPRDVVKGGIDQLDAEAEGLARELAERGAKLADDSGLNAVAAWEACGDSVSATVAKAAEREGAGAIVAGAHRHSAIAEAILGSVARGLLHHSSLPVLVVPAVKSRD